MMHEDLAYRSLLDLQELMTAGQITGVELVRACLERIIGMDRSGPAIRAVIETNPQAEDIAAELDAERARGRIRGPLHGIPTLLKDNIDTADDLSTTAGSLALMGSRPSRDAFVAARLREAGAVILGKTNMSEWANFRSDHSSSGWSARGGQARNPYVLDRSPCGSSSGSATAVAAGYAPASLGTETSGSILCPGAMNGVVGIKPTVGLTSRAGVIPIAHSQDTVGPFARTVADAAAVLAAISGTDERDTATSQAPEMIDYLQALQESTAEGMRVGVLRGQYCGYSPKTDRLAEEAIAALRDAGVEIVDPVALPSEEEMRKSDSMLQILLYEFKADLQAYLEHLGDSAPVHSLADIIRFNDAYAADEMPYFGQELLVKANEMGPLSERAYLEARQTSLRLSRDEGIDAVLRDHRLDALVAPTTGPAWPIDLVNGDAYGGGCAGPAAMAGYPAITVPMGFVQGLPVGLTFMGSAWSESTLLRLAAMLEYQLNARQSPRFLATIAT